MAKIKDLLQFDPELELVVFLTDTSGHLYIDTNNLEIEKQDNCVGIKVKFNTKFHVKATEAYIQEVKNCTASCCKE